MPNSKVMQCVMRCVFGVSPQPLIDSAIFLASRKNASLVCVQLQFWHTAIVYLFVVKYREATGWWPCFFFFFIFGFHHMKEAEAYTTLAIFPLQSSITSKLCYCVKLQKKHDVSNCRKHSSNILFGRALRVQ